jgi:cbb3-type cytochrome c oxidase subunit III
MPAWHDTLSNAEIAAALSYVRSAWGNNAAAISEDQVAAVAAPVASSPSQIFAAKCSTCHGAQGQGSATVPPLAGNADLSAADPKGIIATIVNGRTGALTVNGKTYNGQMPSWKGQLSNADVAAVATFVRSSWGNTGGGVTEAQVASAGTAVSTAIGAAIYAKHCQACHQANGKGGGGGTFPALAGDTKVNADSPTAMLTVVEHGKSIMPSWKGQLSPAEIAAVATYVRSAWGNTGGPVSEADVAAIK